MGAKVEGVIYRYTLNIKGAPDFGKCYVGKSADETTRKEKWQSKSNKNYAGRKIKEAREKYGTKDWDYDVLERITTNTKEELLVMLNERENFWIKKLDAVEKGFNSSYGDGMKGRKHTDESRALISKNHRKYQTEEACKKISESLKGGHRTQETIEKISVGNKDKTRTPEQRKAQSDRMKNVDHTALQEGAAKWREKNPGYWSTHPITSEAKANMKKAQQKRGTATIVEFPDGHTELFNTMTDAYKRTGVKVGSIDYAMKHGNTVKGFNFKKGNKK